MARGKVAMRLVENAGERARKHAKRVPGLKKKASELATLCGVPVGLVCAGARAGAPPLVWESEEGVLERYRRAVPPEARAGHTHRAYLEAELGKRRAKLARARHGCPAALPDWDEALNDMTLDDARALLRAIDAALLATGDRMVALGLPADGGHSALDQQVTPDSSNDAVMPQQIGHGGGVPWTGGDPVDMADAAGFQQLQMVPYDGGNNDDLLEQFPREHGFQMQPGGCGGFQFASGNYSGGCDGMLTLGPANAGCNYSGGGDGMLAPGFASAVCNYSGGGGQMLAPGFGNADYKWPDLTMWHTNEMCDAAMPPGYYPGFADGTLAPQHYSAEVATGGDYVSTLPSGYGYPMGMSVGDDNFTNLGSNYTAAHWQAEAFQRSDASASASTSTSTGELPSAASSRHYLY
ncbi:MADS-box transcription factor 3-like [Triticum urartu]|uniref:MADS-box domain-containing protein n=2 Tax=Triticum urartu TaxID=4572 RepID=A0A8R7V415_TRIUA|nr:MADS-box transcription factor 3-like [Triticum urartu]